MDDLQTGTQPTPGAETPAGGAPAADLELELPAEAVDGDADQVDGGEEELEDWEEEGRTYKVPKALKPHLMRDKDYTQGKQTVAETRKQAEARMAEADERAKWHRENFDSVRKIANFDDQIAAINAVTPEQWAALDRDSPQQAMALTRQLTQLKSQRDAALGELQQKQHQDLEKQRTASAKQYEDSLARIAKDIPGWSDELAGKLNGYAQGKGYSESDLRAMVLQPHAVGTLHKAYLYDQLVAKQRARTPAQAEPTPTPVPKVGARRNPPSSEPLDSDSPEVWLRKRNKQLGIGGR